LVEIRGVRFVPDFWKAYLRMYNQLTFANPKSEQLRGFINHVTG